MKFSWFLALRYLKPKRTFISIITVISIVGVALGVGVLIVVIAVMTGFQKRIKDEWLKVEPPLYLRDDNRAFIGEPDPKPDDENAVAVWRELLPKVKSFPGVESASPYIHVVGLAQQARPKKFQNDEIEVGPPPPEVEPVPEVPPPKEGAVPPPEPPDGGGVKGPTGKPATPGKPGTAQAKPAKTPPAKPASSKPAAAKPGAAKPPATEEPPPAPPATKTAPPAEPSAATPGPPAPPGAVPAPVPGANTPDDAETEEEMSDEDEEDLLERARPLTDVMLMGLDTSDAKLMEKHGKRFTELLNLPDPQAFGEFDVGDVGVVLSQYVVAKLYRRAQDEYPIPGRARYNVFGGHFIKNGIKLIQEQSAAKRKAARLKKLREAKGLPGNPDQAQGGQPDGEERDYPLPETLELTGYFTDDKQQSAGQASIGYISLKTAQRLAGAGNEVDGIFVDLDDPYDAPAMAKKLQESGILPEGWTTETWVQRHRQQFEAVENEIGMMYIVLGFISLVAAFCIMNTMITMAVQKRREIGMMRALGAKTSHIVSLFMTKGFIVGLLGTGIGYVLGRIILVFRNDLRSWINSHFGHQIFDSNIYGLNEIPADLLLSDQVLICGIAFILCTLAAVPPALIVGRMEPARALRNDR